MGDSLYSATTAEEVDFLVKNGKNVNSYSLFDETPLHFACKKKNLEVVMKLCSLGAKIDESNNEGYTAIHFACIAGDLQIVQYLCSLGVDINKGGPSDHIPNCYRDYKAIDYAVMHGNLNIVAYLIESHNAISDKLVYLATYHGWVDILDYLLKKEYDINGFKFDNKKYIPLIAACKKSNIDIIDKLLNNNVKIDKKDGQGATALFTLCSIKETVQTVEITKRLLFFGANINYCNYQLSRLTPLWVSILKNNYNIVKILCEQGADIDSIASQDKQSCLIYAVTKNYIEIVKTLLASGANINYKDNDGLNAFDHCSNDEIKELIKNNLELS